MFRVSSHTFYNKLQINEIWPQQNVQFIIENGNQTQLNLFDIFTGFLSNPFVLKEVSYGHTTSNRQV
jgi:hypothetical protein